jgi:hypothetical protein
MIMEGFSEQNTNFKVHLHDPLRDFTGMSNTGQLSTASKWHSTHGLRKKQLLRQHSLRNRGQEGAKHVPTHRYGEQKTQIFGPVT